MTAVTEACWAMFCGRLKMPPPIIAETTRAASAVTPSFLLSSAMMLIPPLVVSSKLPGAPGASGGGGGVLRRVPDAFAHDDQFGVADRGGFGREEVAEIGNFHEPGDSGAGFDLLLFAQSADDEPVFSVWQAHLLGDGVAVGNARFSVRFEADQTGVRERHAEPGLVEVDRGVVDRHREAESGERGGDLLFPFADGEVGTLPVGPVDRPAEPCGDRGEQFVGTDACVREGGSVGGIDGGSRFDGAVHRLRGIRVEDLGGAAELCRGVVAHAQLAGVEHFRLSPACEEVEVAGVPLRVEVVEAGPFGAVGPVQAAVVDRRPVVAVAAADREEIGAFVVLPRLEVDAHAFVVLAVKLVDPDAEPDLRNRHVVEREHFCDVVAGVVRDVEDQPVEIGIDGDDVLPLPEFGHVGDVHAHVLDQRQQVLRRNELRQVEEHLRAVVDRTERRIVEHRHDRIDPHAVFVVFEPVILGADEQQSGSVGVLQALHRGVAAELERRIVTRLGVRRGGEFGGAHRRGERRRRGVAGVVLLQTGVADPFGLHHLAQVVAEFIGIDVAEHIGFGDDPRVGVVADEVDFAGILLHLDEQLSLDPGAVVAAGIVEVRIAGHAGNLGAV